MVESSFFNLPPTFRGDVQIFQNTGLVGAPSYQVWRKPRNAIFVQFICIAGGGGGGGGFTRTAGNAGGGGGSGACSGMQRYHCPAAFVPDLVYVQVGAGGQGGAASGAGGNGANSYVTTSSRLVAPTLPNILCYSGVNVPGGGGAGTGAGVGGAGTVPTIAVAQPWHAFADAGQVVGLVGLAGGAQTGAVGAAVTAWATIPLSPGGSGAGCTAGDFAGGAITATAALDLGFAGYIPATAGGIALGGTAAGAGVNGSAGFSQWEPFLQSGGAGGGSNNAGQAGDGGRGGIGCGGGGGGAGATGGRGGRGGDGLVIIVSL